MIKCSQEGNTMGDSNRRQLLEQLHNDLSQVEPDDEKGRQLLDDTRTQIKNALDHADDESLVERLQESLYHFEGTHPDLANTISVVIDTLSNMGL
jgi:hypothetical protein